MKDSRPCSDSLVTSRPSMSVLVRAVVAGVLGSTVLSAPVVQAQQSSVATPAARQWRIPAGALNQALSSFALQAGITVAFEPQQVAGRTSAGLSGTYSLDDALSRLLQGTGLMAVSSAPGAYLLREVTGGEAAVLPSIRVVDDPLAIQGLPEAYAGGQVASGARVGVYGNRAIFDVPFSIVPLTRDVIDNQQARTVAEVVRNDASVTVMQGGNTGGSDESYNIRGFRTFGSVATYDGLSGLIGRSQAMEALERVEILKGPSSFLNGMPNATVGGVINYVPKRATGPALTQFTTRYFSDDVVGAHVDVSRRFGQDERFGMRFNGAFREGDTPVKLTTKHNELAALSLDYRGERLRLLGDFDYSDARTDGRLGGTTVVSGIAVPRAPDSRNNWSQPWAEASQIKRRMLVRAEFDIASQWTISAAHGRLDQTDAYYVGCDPNIINAAGDVTFACNTGGSLNDVGSSEVSLRGRFTTGVIEHRLVVGAARVDEKLRNAFVNYALPAGYVSNIYTPAYIDRPTLPTVMFAGKTGATLTESLYFADELAMPDNTLLITLGGRHIEVDAANYNALTGARTSPYVKSAFTPALGVVYKITPAISIYGNYAEAIERSGTAPQSASNRGEVLKPLRSEQIEGGVKVDRGSLGATLGVFRITKANTMLVNNVFGLNGKQINQGVELGVFGELLPGLRLLSSAAWVDAEQTNTQNGTFDGRTAFSVPDLQATAGLEWDAPWLTGLTLTGNLAYTASAYVDAGNTQRIPSWTRVDLGSRYGFKISDVDAMARLYIENATDRNYWSGVDRGSLYLSQPRTVSLSLTISF